MRIESIHCRNYKSIRDAGLENCRSLNILIGKNNAGKSNILQAIEAFYGFVNSPSFVSALRPEEVERDLYREGEIATEKATITATIALSNEERAQLVEEISIEAPQLKNALAALDPSMRLKVEMAIIKNPAMAFTERIDLIDRSGENKETLLYVPADAAEELRKQAVDMERLEDDVKTLEQFRDSISEVVTGRTGRVASIDEQSYRVRTFMRRQGIKANLRDEIFKILDNVQDEASARQILNDLTAEKQDAAERTRSFTLTHQLQTFAGNQGRIPEYISKLLARISTWKILYLDERRKPVGPEEARRLLSLKMRRGGTENLRAIQSAVSSLLGVQIDAFESSVQRRQGEAELLAEMDVDNFLVQVNGSGIRESLRLILDVNFEHPDALLLEEPEVHLHPALEYSLLQYLKDESEIRQIFITTHSTNFLDTVGASNIYLVSRDNETQVVAINGDELGEKIPREMGIRLSSVFMFDRIVFIEGPSDELILRELASKLEINLAVSAVGFVQTAGARSFSHFANATTLDILSRRQVKIFFVLDRDERTEEEIESMKSMCDGKASVHVLARREIENYLVHPEAIASLISSKTGGQLTPSSEEIHSHISQCVSELRDTTVSRRFLHKNCTPIFFNRDALKTSAADALATKLSSELEQIIEKLNETRADLEQQLNETKDEVARQWEKDALAMVPGADLIDLVMEKYGLRFKKRKDGPALAKFIPASDIPAELHSVLRHIVSH